MNDGGIAGSRAERPRRLRSPPMNMRKLVRFRALPVATVAAALAALAAPSEAAVGEWVGGDHARVRLVAAGVDAAGNLSAGIEIELDSGWHTYWRSPGDAGMAPAIDFAGSLNIDEPSV